MPSYVMSFIVVCDTDAAAQTWCSESNDAVSAAGAAAEIPGAYMVGSGGIARVYDGDVEAE